jgi:hypothetical protein
MACKESGECGAPLASGQQMGSKPPMCTATQPLPKCGAQLESHDARGRCHLRLSNDPSRSVDGPTDKGQNARWISHGRSHRFDPCHAHQHKQAPESSARAQLPADCQQTTLSRCENALSAVRFEGLDSPR